MTLDEASALCSEWQSRLALTHWDIAICISRARYLEGKVGEVNFTQRNLTANITLLDPVDYPDGPHKQDMENTIVHELLHLWICPFQPDPENVREEIAMEQAICKIADALVMLKRERTK